jgi:hypothetical protein
MWYINMPNSLLFTLHAEDGDHASQKTKEELSWSLVLKLTYTRMHAKVHRQSDTVTLVVIIGWRNVVYKPVLLYAFFYTCTPGTVMLHCEKNIMISLMKFGSQIHTSAILCGTLMSLTQSTLSSLAWRGIERRYITPMLLSSLIYTLKAAVKILEIPDKDIHEIWFSNMHVPNPCESFGSLWHHSDRSAAHAIKPAYKNISLNTSLSSPYSTHCGW